MKVWDRVRGTIRQFADAIADAEPDNLDADEIYNEILRAIWTGAFEDGETCEVCLPSAQSGIEARPDGSWRESWTTLGDARWSGDTYRDLPRPFLPFTREELRKAALDWSDVGMLADDAGNLAFDVLAGLTAADYGESFRKTYLDALLIETAAIRLWWTAGGVVSGSPTENGDTKFEHSAHRLETHGKNDPEVTYSTGVPGRPTSKHLLVPEAERRLAELPTEEPFPTLTSLAVDLGDWLATTHPRAAQATVRTIENTLRPLWRSARNKRGKNGKP